jgi:hypothetical protein
MTYSTAAPMMYKEVVVNNFASFFLGVDDPVKEHHQACTSYPSTQTRLCHLVRRKDGKPYNCPRHDIFHQVDDEVDHLPTATPTPFALYHKQELLTMVEPSMSYTQQPTNTSTKVSIPIKSRMLPFPYRRSSTSVILAGTPIIQTVSKFCRRKTIHLSS